METASNATSPLRGVIYATGAWLVMSGVSHGQADCGDWNRPEFFENASISDVERCVLAGADLEERNKHGWAPIFWAAWIGNPDAVGALLDAGADFSARDNDGRSPLHLVAAKGGAEMVTAMLSAGAEIEARDKNGWTPIFWAARLGNTKALGALLEAGADFSARDNDGRVPLHLAAAHGDAEMVTAMLRAGAEIEARNNEWRDPDLIGTASINAIRIPLIVLLECWRRHQSARSIHDGKVTSFTAVAAAGEPPQWLTAMLNAGAKIEARDNDGWTPIFWAARRKAIGKFWSPCLTQVQTSRLAIMTGDHLCTWWP